MMGTRSASASPGLGCPRASAWVLSALLFTIGAGQASALAAGRGVEPQPQAAEPDASERDIAPILEPLRAASKLPALGAVVVEGGRIVAAGMTGVRKAGSDAPARLDDPFHLGSNTKAMTALLVARLAEQGTLSFETTLGEVFRGTIPEMHEAWEKVSLADLLRNRGGCSGVIPPLLWRSFWTTKEEPVAQRTRLVRAVISGEPIAAPGQKYEYSNTGFAFAGAMAETKTGTAWEALMRAHVFEPLGMESAGFGAPGADDDQGAIKSPWGHQEGGRPVEPGPRADNPPAIAPANAVHMNLRDWAKYIGLHLRSHASNPHRRGAFLPAHVFDVLHEPVGDYACGWRVLQRGWAKGTRDEDVGITLMHAGSNTMWFSVAWLAPEKDFAVLVVTNQGGAAAQRATDEAVGEILKAMESW